MRPRGSVASTNRPRLPRPLDLLAVLDQRTWADRIHRRTEEGGLNLHRTASYIRHCNSRCMDRTQRRTGVSSDHSEACQH